MGVFRRQWPGVSYGRGEDWHYVGETGEPAFQNGWVNAGIVAILPLAFRMREAGIVDIHGKVEGGTPGTTIFTLPAKCRPDHNSWAIVYGDTGSSIVPAYAYISPAGELAVESGVANPTTVIMAAQFFLAAPDPAAV